jgi:spermidine/putrescine transport system substrate-binding protein
MRATEGAGMLKRLVLLMVAGVVTAACGKGGGGSSSLDAPACLPGQTDGDLALYSWTDYLPTGPDATRLGVADLVADFEDEYGVHVTLDYYISNEELHAKLQTGTTAYDVIVPSDYMASTLIAEGLLTPLRLEAIPNRVNIDPTFLNPPFDPEQRYHMPYLWGTTGIGLSLRRLPTGLPNSWDLIFDPELSVLYSGRISLLDDARETLGAALRHLGYSLNTTSEAEIREAGDLLADTLSRGAIAVFDSASFANLLTNGVTVVAHGYSGDFFREFSQLAAGGRDPSEDFAYIVPEEGGVLWVDAMAVPANAPHPCTAHAFINFILDPVNGAELANFTHFASPNAVAEYWIWPEIKWDPSIYPPPEVFDRLEFIVDLGDVNQIYEQVFAEARR